MLLVCFLLILVTLAGWLNRKQQSVIEYLLEENRVLKQQLNASGKKLRLSNVPRRSLAKKAKARGHDAGAIGGRHVEIHV